MHRSIFTNCVSGLSGPKVFHTGICVYVRDGMLTGRMGIRRGNLVDPASSHMLVSKIKPCMCKCKLYNSGTANGSLKQ